MFSSTGFFFANLPFESGFCWVTLAFEVSLSESDESVLSDCLAFFEAGSLATFPFMAGDFPSESFFDASSPESESDELLGGWLLTLNLPPLNLIITIYFST